MRPHCLYRIKNVAWSTAQTYRNGIVFIVFLEFVTMIYVVVCNKVNYEVVQIGYSTKNKISHISSQTLQMETLLRRKRFLVFFFGCLNQK